MDIGRIDELDGQGAAEALVSSTARVRAEEAGRLRLLGQWAVLHDEASIVAPTDRVGRPLPGVEQAVVIGGDGTPAVAEFAVHDLAAMLGLPFLTARNLLADVLDLVHRHPVLWARLEQTAHCADPGVDPALALGLPQGWQATKVARRCRAVGLSLAEARWVDAHTTDDLAGLPWTRFVAVLEERIKEAAPALAEQRRRAAEATKKVTVSRTNEDGMKRLTVQLPAAQIIWMRARLHQLAQLLQAHGATTPMTELEADAAFVLTNPGEALRLLLAGAALDPQPTGDTQSDDTASDADDPHAVDEPVADTDEADPSSGLLDLFGDRRLHPDEPVSTGEALRHPFDHPILGDTRMTRRLREHDAHAHQPPDPDSGPDPGYHPGPPPDLPGDPSDPGDACPTCGRAPGESSAHHPATRATRVPDLPAGARIDPAKLRPKAVLHLHGRISDFRTGQGSFRLEHDTGIGLSHAEMLDLLGHAHVTVRPVIDLNHQVPVDAHEVPAELAEAARQLHPYTVSPFSTTRSRGTRVDTDHTQRYVADPDQPGQTRLDNLGPLGRGGHRYKTFARGVTVAQPTLGVLVWRTRYGFCFQVDQHGTHPLGKMTATQFHALVTELALEDTDQPDDEDLAG